MVFYFFFSSRRRHTISKRDWSSDVCSSDLFSSRDASSLVFLVLPLAILDASLDVNLVALLAIFLDDVGETGALGVPHHRSEERRVGKECRARGVEGPLKIKDMSYERPLAIY